MKSLAVRDPYREAAPLAPSAPRALHPPARYLLLGASGAGFFSGPRGRLLLLAAGYAASAAVLLLLFPRHLVPLVFFAVQTVFVLFRAVPAIRALLAQRRTLYTYRIGTPARARVVGDIEKVATGDAETGRAYKLSWELELDGVTYSGSLVHVDRRALEAAIDDDRVTVLYDPKNPAINTLWIEESAALAARDFPGGLALDRPREITPRARKFLLGTSTGLLLFGGLFSSVGFVVFLGFVLSALAQGEFTLWILHPFVFLCAGSGMLFYAIRARRRTLRAYKRGEVAQGRIIERSEAGFHVNHQPMFRVRWAYVVDGVKYEGSLLHRDGAAVATTLPDDEVSVLYDPANPKVSTLLIE